MTRAAIAAVLLSFLPAGCTAHQVRRTGRLEKCNAEPQKNGVTYQCPGAIFAAYFDVEDSAPLATLLDKSEQELSNDLKGLQKKSVMIEVAAEKREGLRLYSGGGGNYSWGGEMVAAKVGGFVRIAICGGAYSALPPRACRDILAEILTRPGASAQDE